MSKSKRNKGRGKRPAAGKQHERNDKPRYGVQFTEKGRDTLAEIFSQYQDRPLYYVLDEHGEAVPVGRNYLLTTEERAHWRARTDDPKARMLAETVIPNPEHPAYPVVVHTAFMGKDESFAYPLPNGAPALWRTSLLEKPFAERMADVEVAEEDDGSWLLEDVPETPAEVVALAQKLGLGIEAFEEWSRVYSTRAAALEGHAETVRWIRRALGVF